MPSERLSLSAAPRETGLAVIGCGRIGRIRAEIAHAYPGIGWLGLCDTDEALGQKLNRDVNADFFTTDYAELVRRPEVSAVIVATGEDDHTDPALEAIRHGHRLLIEKPIAGNVTDSLRIVEEIHESGVDAVVGYSMRFNRKFLSAKQAIDSGALGQVTSVTARALINRLIPGEAVRRSSNPSGMTPMLVSGTHCLDLSRWFMERRRPVEVYARSLDKILGNVHDIQDTSAGLWSFDDGSLLNICVSWAMPTSWPASVYGLDMAILGTDGVLTIDDTHRDMILASDHAVSAAYSDDSSRSVEFLGSFIPGDYLRGRLWGPMRDETISWFERIANQESSPHTTAVEAHENLLMALTMDLSARRAYPVTYNPVKLAKLLSHE